MNGRFVRGSIAVVAVSLSLGWAFVGNEFSRPLGFLASMSISGIAGIVGGIASMHLWKSVMVRQFVQRKMDRMAYSVLSPNWLRALDLFKLLLDKKTREKVFDPSYNELREDFVGARKKYRTRFARWWVAFCLPCRIAVLFIACVRNMVGTAIFNVLLLFVPAQARELLRQMFRIN